MKKTSILVAMASLAFAANAATWWVDDDWYNQGGDGSEARPFGTIQDALDNSSLAAGDTVKVKAGVYDKGGKGGVSYGGSISNRVVITKKVHLLAVDGRDNTFIVGAPDPNPINSSGMGPAATRCIFYPRLSEGGTIIEGFTICNGRTDNIDQSTGNNANAGYGAALMDYSNNYGISVGTARYPTAWPVRAAHRATGASIAA